MNIYSRKNKIVYISDNDSSNDESIKQMDTDDSDKSINQTGNSDESINQTGNSDDEYINKFETRIPNVHTLSVNDVMNKKKKNGEEKLPVIYRCKICYSKLKTKEGLLKHVQNHKLISCQYCSYKCQLKEVMTRHLIKHGIFNRIYDCRHCEKKFKRLTDRKNHECLEHSLKGFKCKSCSDDFSSYSKLRTHVARNHPHLCKYFCNVCKIGFPYKSQLDMHSKCGHKTSKSGKYLFQHRKDGTNTMPFRGSDYFVGTCSLCKASVSNITELKSHLMEKHEEFAEMKTFGTLNKCEFCDKIFKESRSAHRNNLAFAHICLHFNMWLYKCDSCDYKCTYRNSLRNHMMHLANSVNIKKHKCTICRQSFCFKYTLRRHIIFCGKSQEEVNLIIINNRSNPSRRKRDRPCKNNKPHIDRDTDSTAGRSNKKRKRAKKLVIEAKCNMCNEVFHKFCDLKYHLDRHRFNEYGNNSALQSLIKNIMQITEMQSFPDIATQSQMKRLENGIDVLECEICGDFLQNLFLYSQHSTLHEKEYKGK